MTNGPHAGQKGLDQGQQFLDMIGGWFDQTSEGIEMHPQELEALHG